MDTDHEVIHRPGKHEKPDDQRYHAAISWPHGENGTFSGTWEQVLQHLLTCQPAESVIIGKNATEPELRMIA